jgi:hypothetical protein
MKLKPHPYALIDPLLDAYRTPPYSGPPHIAKSAREVCKPPGA